MLNKNKILFFALSCLSIVMAIHTKQEKYSRKNRDQRQQTENTVESKRSKEKTLAQQAKKLTRQSNELAKEETKLIQQETQLIQKEQQALQKAVQAEQQEDQAQHEAEQIQRQEAANLSEQKAVLSQEEKIVASAERNLAKQEEAAIDFENFKGSITKQQAENIRQKSYYSKTKHEEQALARYDALETLAEHDSLILNRIQSRAPEKELKSLVIERNTLAHNINQFYTKQGQPAIEFLYISPNKDLYEVEYSVEEEGTPETKEVRLVEKSSSGPGKKIKTMFSRIKARIKKFFNE